jgi:hypothetical protein
MAREPAADQLVATAVQAGEEFNLPEWRFM